MYCNPDENLILPLHLRRTYRVEFELSGNGVLYISARSKGEALEMFQQRKFKDLVLDASTTAVAMNEIEQVEER